MISVQEALSRVLGLFSPMPSEVVPLECANGRVLVKDVFATRDQPPFASSSMDGYAIQSRDLVAGNTLNVIGQSAAGHRYDGTVQLGQAVRIFTGGVVPDGADHILIQEDAIRSGNQITISDGHDTASYIRPKGGDFEIGAIFTAPKILGPVEIGMLAAMNIPNVEVTRKPVIALMATGDELVRPGEKPTQDQIISSNNYALAAMIQSAGGIARILPIARDNAESLAFVYNLAADADAIVTLGGASVGDHDLVASVGQENGLELDFYKVAMRPGKPLMAGRFRDKPMLGLPGNPVSSIVCGEVFLRPAIKAMLGQDGPNWTLRNANLAEPLGPNGPRSHFMRGEVLDNGTVRAFDRQDSSLLSVLAAANCLIIREPNAPEIGSGEMVQIILL